jgi:hypothetical protein
VSAPRLHISIRALSMYCQQHTLVKWDGANLTAYPLRCKSWGCVKCAPWRAKLLKDEALAGKPGTFITLTCNPHYRASPEERAQNLVNAWRIIVRRLRARPAFKSLQYLVVMERTQKGEPHLHILARMPYLKQAILSAWMRELSNAPIVWIEHVKNNSKVAGYVAKYVGKGPHRYEGCKRYWKSQDYMHPTRSELRAQRDPDTVWYSVPVSFEVYKTTVKHSELQVTRDWYSSIQAHAPPWIAAPPGCHPL